jgi:hypothetical protein
MASDMKQERDILQCPDCKRPDALRIRYEADEDTAVCGYCGATVSLIDFGKQRRRAAIGTIVVGFLVIAAGLVTWLCTDGWHGFFNTGTLYPGAEIRFRFFVESKRYDMMPLLRVSGAFFSISGLVVVLVGLRKFLGWRRSWR